MYKNIGKRLFDLIGAVFLILIISPLLLVISFFVLIKMGRPIFFIQQRVGKEGEHFGIIKFRTMINGAESQGSGLDSYSNDPRVTKLGKFLRNTSLDELPQVVNIIKGDMSFVGPRPPVTYSPYKYQDYPKYAKTRFSVRPGVTGLAQINGRNELNWEEKFAFDAEYVNSYSLTKDLLIIFQTAYKVLINEGSYDNERNKK